MKQTSLRSCASFCRRADWWTSPALEKYVFMDSVRPPAHPPTGFLNARVVFRRVANDTRYIMVGKLAEQEVGMPKSVDFETVQIGVAFVRIVCEVSGCDNWLIVDVWLIDRRAGTRRVRLSGSISITSAVIVSTTLPRSRMVSNLIRSCLLIGCVHFLFGVWSLCWRNSFTEIFFGLR